MLWQDTMNERKKAARDTRKTVFFIVVPPYWSCSLNNYIGETRYNNLTAREILHYDDNVTYHGSFHSRLTPIQNLNSGGERVEHFGFGIADFEL